MADGKPQFACLPWYPRDFASATADWSLAERGLYRELLDQQWDLGSLPADHSKLRMLVRVTPQEWRMAWPTVSKKFEVGEDGRLRNLRLEVHRCKSIEKHGKRSDAGKKGNEKRWGGRGGKAGGAVIHAFPERGVDD